MAELKKERAQDLAENDFFDTQGCVSFCTCCLEKIFKIVVFQE